MCCAGLPQDAQVARPVLKNLLSQNKIGQVVARFDSASQTLSCLQMKHIESVHSYVQELSEAVLIVGHGQA